MGSRMMLSPTFDLGCLPLTKLPPRLRAQLAIARARGFVVTVVGPGGETPVAELLWFSETAGRGDPLIAVRAYSGDKCDVRVDLRHTGRVFGDEEQALITDFVDTVLAHDPHAAAAHWSVSEDEVVVAGVTFEAAERIAECVVTLLVRPQVVGGGGKGARK